MKARFCGLNAQTNLNYPTHTLQRTFDQRVDLQIVAEVQLPLANMTDDPSDLVARQEKELATAQRRIAMLMEREAAREMDAGGTIPLGDQKPPHW